MEAFPTCTVALVMKVFMFQSLENEQVFAGVVRVVDGDVGRSSCSGWSQLQSRILRVPGSCV